MKKSIVISTRTNIITVAKLAQFYDTQLRKTVIYTKSALINACLEDYFNWVKRSGLLDKDNELIATEEQAYKYLTLQGYNVSNKDMTIPKDIFKNIRKESISDVEEDIKTIKASILKADKGL